MKLFIVALSLFLTGAPTPLIVVDKALKKPLQSVAVYTTQDYLKGTFPIYTAERDALVAAADKVAKWIERTEACYSIDSIRTEHTLFRLLSDCEGGLNVTVTMFTEIAETATTYSFILLKNEGDKRKAQEKLMDFATYIGE
ncbi:MAG: hypothetical protein EOO14_16170 [Chitinophagaceae bacterium]|nr:MAG: hypothetical protein EOO14_16170 [Chitinophagaceae bacterium]